MAEQRNSPWRTGLRRDIVSRGRLAISRRRTRRVDGEGERWRLPDLVHHRLSLAIRLVSISLLGLKAAGRAQDETGDMPRWLMSVEKVAVIWLLMGPLLTRMMASDLSNVGPASAYCQSKVVIPECGFLFSELIDPEDGPLADRMWHEGWL